MNQIASGIVVAAVVGLLSVGAIGYGNTTATDGLAALSRKYNGKCIGLSDGRRGTIAGFSAKGINVTARDADGGKESIVLRRAPDLDRFVVPCPVSGD